MPSSEDQGEVAEPSAAGPVDPRTIPVPRVATVMLQVTTPEPGFAVFINGEPTRDAQGERLTTPCRVAVPRGECEVLVARSGHTDAVQRILAISEKTTAFPEIPVGDDTNSILSSAYLEAPLGKPIPLLTVNSPGAELDPVLSPDGRSLWLVGRRGEGTGIYTAGRRTPFHFFGPPQFLSATETFDLPATPSIADDGRLLAYALPEKQRVYACTRPSNDGPFGTKELVQFNPQGNIVWDSAQLLDDACRLYWTERRPADGHVAGFAAVRKSPDQPFGRPIPYDLPGGHPCLSSDGLRQYVFDGTTLRRARRATLRDAFSALEEIARLDLPNYIPSKTRRQYFVSDDEQWMIYSDNPDAGGDLYLVRLATGPGWGYVPRGEPLALPKVAAATPSPPMTPAVTPETPKPVEPPKELTRYADFRAQFLALVAKRQYQDAAQLIRRALAAPALREDRPLIEWDRQELQNVEGVWSDARRAAGLLKPGQPVRIGGIRLEFVRLDDDMLVATLRGKEVRKPLSEFDPAELVALIDSVGLSDDPAVPLRIGTFLSLDHDGNARSAATRLEQAQDAGREFLERRAGRLLHQSRRAFDADRIAEGLTLAEQVVRDFPESRAAQQARQLQQNVYKTTEWRTVGPRQWQTPEPGTYYADLTRQPNSWLLSPREYGNFELRLEWKTVASPLAQGGVFFHYDNRGRPYNNAFKLQLANDAGRRADPQSTGSLFNYEAPTLNATRKAGEWNTLILRVQGDNVRVTINGQAVLDTTAVNDDVPSTGFVALDGVVGGITYRKILLIELPATGE